MTTEAPPIPHPVLHQRVADSLARQGLMRHLQARLVRVAPATGMRLEALLRDVTHPQAEDAEAAT